MDRSPEPEDVPMRASCLNDHQLDLLLSGLAGLRHTAWQRHVRQCAVCRARAASVRENLLLAEAIRKAIGPACCDPAESEPVAEVAADVPAACIDRSFGLC